MRYHRDGQTRKVSLRWSDPRVITDMIRLMQEPVFRQPTDQKVIYFSSVQRVIYFSVISRCSLLSFAR